MRMNKISLAMLVASPHLAAYAGGMGESYPLYCKEELMRDVHKRLRQKIWSSDLYVNIVYK